VALLNGLYPGSRRPEGNDLPAVEAKDHVVVVI
jgi:hypothetical protein